MRALAIVLMLGTAAKGWCLTNLLSNPSFETDTNGSGVAEGWDGEIHTNEGAQGRLQLDRQVKHSGAASQRLEHTSANSAWLRVSQEPLPARPDAAYRVAVWVNAKGPYSVLLYEFRKNGLEYLTNTVAGGEKTDGWVEVSKVFMTTKEADHFKLSLIANGPGTVWFDDASVALVAERPYLKAPRVRSAPALNGRLDAPVWQQTPEVTGFFVLDGKGQTAPVQTSVKVMFDSEALLIGFRCEEPNMAGLVKGVTGDDPRVWQDDCVEVFLTTEPDQGGYVHLGLGAGGGQWQERTLGSTWYTDWYSFSSGNASPPQFQARVVRGDKWWSGELRLPFSQVGGVPAVGKTWGLQLCRTRRAGGAEENSSWSYTDGNRYAQPDRFGTLVFCAPPSVPPQLVSREIVAEKYTPVIIPQPVSLEWKPGVFRVTPETAIYIADASQRPEAELLRGDLESRFGLKLRLAEGVAPAKAINLAVSDGRPAPGDEGYRLQVETAGIGMVAGGARGRLYGVETLRQMLAADERGPFVRCAVIGDEPSLKWRGWHMSSPGAAELPAFKRMVDTLALLKYNTIVWEVDGNLQYQTHPDLGSDRSPTKAQLKELVDHAKLRHFEVIPQLATFSHFDYILHRPAYQHLAESPKTTKGFESLSNYCPSNPEVYQLVFDLMGELVEVFQPRYFHIGHDEASFDDIGVCDRCRGKDPWVLWAEDINKLDGWIKEHGMRAAMWGDQLLPQHNGDKPFFTARATDLVAKDVLIFDWHYEPTHNYDETIQYFKQHGFEVVGCPWYEPRNVYDYASAAKRNGILGYCGTTWSGLPDPSPALPQLPAAWVIGGENSWSTDRPLLKDITYSPVPQFHRLWSLSGPGLPRSLRLVDLSGFCNESLVDTERHDGWMGVGPLYDLRSLSAGVVWAGDIPFRIVDAAANSGKACVMLADSTTAKGVYPEGVFEIPVGLKTTALYFLQTCSLPPARDRDLYSQKNPTALGGYVVNYADGTQQRIPLRYLTNISDWNGQLGPAQAVGLWQGHTAGGALISLGAVEWQNPRSEVEIRSLDFTSALSSARPVLLGLSAAPASAGRAAP